MDNNTPPIPAPIEVTAAPPPEVLVPASQPGETATQKFDPIAALREQLAAPKKLKKVERKQEEKQEAVEALRTQLAQAEGKLQQLKEQQENLQKVCLDEKAETTARNYFQIAAAGHPRGIIQEIRILQAQAIRRILYGHNASKKNHVACNAAVISDREQCTIWESLIPFIESLCADRLTRYKDNAPLHRNFSQVIVNTKSSIVGRQIDAAVLREDLERIEGIIEKLQKEHADFGITPTKKRGRCMDLDTVRRAVHTQLNTLTPDDRRTLLLELGRQPAAKKARRTCTS